jgi:hypothetical protein
VKTPTYGRWWLHEKYVEDGANDDHDEQTCDHRHFVSELNLGWMLWTPAGRLEKITRMEPENPDFNLNWWWRIWTEETEKADPNWSWRLKAGDRVYAVRPNPLYKPHLRFVDLGDRASATMHIVPAVGYDIPDFSITLVQAQRHSQGPGWKVADRPDGGDLVVSEHPDKAKARAELIKAGRRHAKILGLPLYKEEDLAGNV